jgi:hypothetical protein
MKKYYVITATIDGEAVELFGSFDKNDCKYELEANKQQWKDEGHKSIKIVTRATKEEPDAEVYDNLVTREQLFSQQAPNFNFELGADEIVKRGLEVGFISEVKDGLYLINKDY